MSLDVSLRFKGTNVVHPADRIFIRENGQTKEISAAEWSKRFPNQEPVTLGEYVTDKIYSANITHNLGKMAEEAGIYQALWRPEEIGITKAGQLIEPLTRGLKLLKSEPGRFRLFNPSNGWGDYEGLTNFVGNYLLACLLDPDADVEVSR